MKSSLFILSFLFLLMNVTYAVIQTFGGTGKDSCKDKLQFVSDLKDKLPTFPESQRVHIESYIKEYEANYLKGCKKKPMKKSKSKIKRIKTAEDLRKLDEELRQKEKELDNLLGSKKRKNNMGKTKSEAKAGKGKAKSTKGKTNEKPKQNKKTIKKEQVKSGKKEGKPDKRGQSKKNEL